MITRQKSLLQALIVTILWSSSWVLIKLTIDHALPPLTFAGLRYTLACIFLIPPILANPQHRRVIASLPGKRWIQLFLYGIIGYTTAQGALFIALQYIPAAMLNLLLNLSPVVVGIAGIPLLHDRPTMNQWVGVAISVGGVLVYFYSQSFPVSHVIGIGAATLCMLANSGSTLLGRHINSKMNLPPAVITLISMGFGSLLLLTTGLSVQGVGEIHLDQWMVIAWLAIVNTALAWTLWNRSLQFLRAIEASLVASLMLPQTALLAFVFLGETLSLLQVGGLILVGIGALLVQQR